ncbi:unnamed protein product [Paramecium primaurelia]|uniref:Uncharacterized protein n=1 Tax=Paramecium primaurelia TaxID=5886 RepID=A0A8S1QPS3_PARPR|nr:unnamed protein product [Paramecium primaurelia]
MQKTTVLDQITSQIKYSHFNNINQIKLPSNLSFQLAIKRLSQILRYFSQNSNEPCSEYFLSVQQIILSNNAQTIKIIMSSAQSEKGQDLKFTYSKAFNLEHQVYLEH